VFPAIGETWNIWAAPLTFFAWTGFGYWIGIRMENERRTPPRWPLFITYVALFIAP
jgi:hypothetical protein